MLAMLPEPLTPREAAVLERLCAGLSNRQLAQELGVSEQTVKFHLKNIYGKLGASGRTQAVLLARQLVAEPVDHRNLDQAAADLRRRMEPVLTPLDYARRSRRVFGDREAVVDGERRFSYREFLDRCDRAAAALAALGVQHGDRVAVIAPNSHPALELFYAVPALGAVIVPLNLRLSVTEHAELIDHCGARVVCAGRESTASLLELRARLGGVRHWIALDAPEPGWLGYEALLAVADEPPPPVTIVEDDLIAINYTSGTTQRPRGVMVSHRAAWANVLNIQTHWPLKPEDRYLWLLPFAHANGWGFVWAVTAAGAAHICLRDTQREAVVERVLQDRVTAICAARSALQMLLSLPASLRSRLPPGLRVLTAGSAPSLAMLVAAERDLDWRITHAYGLSESAVFIACCDQPAELVRNGSPDARARFSMRQGVPAKVACDLRVVDEEGEEVPRDGQTIGEVVVRSVNVMRGYYRDPAATLRAFAGGWLHTGDAAVVHPDGYFEICDRIKDVIISDDQLVASLEVETVLAQHPAVAEVAVVGQPDELLGERIVAWVVARDTARLDSVELARYAESRLAPFKRPQRYELLAELPRTATGKLSKRVLRERVTGSPSPG